MSMKVTAAGTQQANWGAEPTGLGTDFSFTIEDGDINMLCVTSRLNDGDFNEIYKRAYHSCRAVVDLFAFATGCGLLVHLHSVVWTDGKTWPIQSIRKELPPLVTAFTLERASVDHMKALLAADLASLIVLNDLIDAFNSPNHTPTHCARAIEGLRHLVANTADKGDAWKVFRDTLRLSEDYVRYVTRLSQGPRHGDPAYIEAELNAEIGTRSWKIMNRYFEYLKRGKQPLPAAEFPLL